MRRRPTTPDDIRGRQSEECEGEEEDEEGGVEGQREQGEEEEKERRLLCSLDRRRLSEALRTTAGRTDGRTDRRATRIGDCNCGGGGGEGRERESVWGGAMVDEAAVVRTFAVGAS